jgi:hypothetical protein
MTSLTSTTLGVTIFFASGVVVISGIEEGLFVVQPRLREGKPGRGGG